MRREARPKTPANDQDVLDAHDIARKGNVSYWTAREWILSGALRRLELPGRNGNLRRLLTTAAEWERFLAKGRV